MTPFRSRAFRWLWARRRRPGGATDGAHHDGVAGVATGGGAFAVGLVFAARSLPSLLFGLAAGTIADRVDRRRQLLAVAGVAFRLMRVGWLVGAGTVRLWQVIAIAFAAGCLQVSDRPRGRHSYSTRVHGRWRRVRWP